jgi:hypothetical protein
MIFIVGMPRSGTTLVEQILSCHDDVFGCGELTHIASLASGLKARYGSAKKFPTGLDDLDQNQLSEMRDEYVREVRFTLSSNGIDRPPQFVIDKMPTNFRYLGLIQRVFPDAKILHICRDPRDVAVSCLEQNLAWPFCVPEALSQYIKSYQQIMQHATQCLGDAMLNIRYEQLIDSSRSSIQAILTFLGVKWQDACLNFDQSKRPVSTPSKYQIRQPIHKRSVGKWQKYERFEPVLFEVLCG